MYMAWLVGVDADARATEALEGAASLDSRPTRGARWPSRTRTTWGTLSAVTAITSVAAIEAIQSVTSVDTVSTS